MWHMDVGNFLLEMTPRPLNDHTLVEHATLHPSFQKPGIDSVYKWANRSAYHAKLLQPVGSADLLPQAFLKGALHRDTRGWA